MWQQSWWCLYPKNNYFSTNLISKSKYIITLASTKGKDYFNISYKQTHYSPLTATTPTDLLPQQGSPRPERTSAEGVLVKN